MSGNYKLHKDEGACQVMFSFMIYKAMRQESHRS